MVSHTRAVFGMVVVALLWSIAGVVTRHLQQAHGFEITFWRSFFTAVSLLVILPLWRGADVLETLPWRSRMFWVSGFCWATMFTAFMVGLSLTTVANVLVTMALGPLFTALFSRIFLAHKLTPRTWAAIVVAGCGIAYMQSANMGLGLANAWLGFLVALCVPIAAAVQWTLMQHNQRHHADGIKPDMVPCVFIGAAISALLVLPLAWPMHTSLHDVGLLAFLGLVQLAIPCVLSVLCAAVLKAPEAALLQLLEIIFGILWAWVGANEEPSLQVLTGGGLVISALVFNEVLSWRQRNAAAEQLGIV